MKVLVTHSKLLQKQAFESIGGSPQGATMRMNRVNINFLWSSDLGVTASVFLAGCKEIRHIIEEHLRTMCRNYYYFDDSSNSDIKRDFFFLSKSDMDEFMVWAALTLPSNE